jgi:hypothetical protein
MAAPQDAVALPEAVGHKLSISGDIFALKTVDDRLIGSVSEAAKPRLPKKIHLAVIDIRSKRRIGENKVDRIIWKATQVCCRTSTYYRLTCIGPCCCLQVIQDSSGLPLECYEDIGFVKNIGNVEVSRIATPGPEAEFRELRYALVKRSEHEGQETG